MFNKDSIIDKIKYVAFSTSQVPPPFSYDEFKDSAGATFSTPPPTMVYLVGTDYFPPAKRPP